MRTRRRYLRGVAVAGGVALAGCSDGETGGGNGDGGGSSPDGGDGGDGGGGTATPTAIRSVADREPGWVSQYGSAAKLRHNPVTGPDSVPEALWSTSVPDGFVQVRGRGETVVLVDRENARLVGYDAASGEERWTASFDISADLFRATARTAIAGDVLAVESSSREGEGVAAGFDLASGEELWRQGANRRLVASYRGAFYRIVGTEEDEIALERRDTAWEVSETVPLPSPAAANAPVFAGDRLLHLNDSESDLAEVIALDLASGEELWRASLPDRPSGREVRLPFLLATGRTAFATFPSAGDRFGGNVAAFDLGDGSELWRRYTETPAGTPTGSGGKVQRIAGAPGYLYVSYVNSGRVEVREERTGELATAVGAAAAEPTFGFLASDAAASYYLRVGTQGGERTRSLVARDTAGGSERWTTQLDGLVQAYPVGSRVATLRSQDENQRLTVLG